VATGSANAAMTGVVSFAGQANAQGIAAAGTNGGGGTAGQPLGLLLGILKSS
jgi:hypothetical protein